MNGDRNIKVPDSILSTLLLSKTELGLKRFSQNMHIFFNFVTLKMGVALHFSLQFDNHKSQRSDFAAVCKANNGTELFHYGWLIFFMQRRNYHFRKSYVSFAFKYI